MRQTNSAKCSKSPDGVHSWDDTLVCIEKGIPVVVCEYCEKDPKGGQHKIVNR